MKGGAIVESFKKSIYPIHMLLQLASMHIMTSACT